MTYDNDATEAAWLLMHAFADTENAIDFLRQSRKPDNREFVEQLRNLRTQIDTVLTTCRNRDDIDF